jgi:hypothetical protein
MSVLFNFVFIGRARSIMRLYSVPLGPASTFLVGIIDFHVLNAVRCLIKRRDNCLGSGGMFPLIPILGTLNR